MTSLKGRDIGHIETVLIFLNHDIKLSAHGGILPLVLVRLKRKTSGIKDLGLRIKDYGLRIKLPKAES
jgi:hypothetical protein